MLSFRKLIEFILYGKMDPQTRLKENSLMEIGNSLLGKAMVN
jgi:hypothetical protein